MVQALSKLHILAQIGDEYADHISCLLRLKLLDLIWHSSMLYRGKAVGSLAGITYSNWAHDTQSGGSLYQPDS